MEPAQIKAFQEALKKKYASDPDAAAQLLAVAAGRYENGDLSDELDVMYNSVKKHLEEKSQHKTAENKKLIEQIEATIAKKEKEKQDQQRAALEAQIAEAKAAAQKKLQTEETQESKKEAKEIKDLADDEKFEEQEPPEDDASEVVVIKEGKTEPAQILEKFNQDIAESGKQLLRTYDNELDHAIYYALAQAREENSSPVLWNDNKETLDRVTGEDNIRPNGRQRREAYKKLGLTLGVSFENFKIKNTNLTNTKGFRAAVHKKMQELNRPSGFGLDVSGGAGTGTVHHPVLTTHAQPVVPVPQEKIAEPEQQTFRVLQTSGQAVNCLFRSIAYGIHKEETDELAARYRKEACDYMEEHIDKFRNFMIAEDAGVPPDSKDGQYNEGKLNAQAKRYIERMRGQVYGDQPEISALASKLKRPIVVLRGNGDVADRTAIDILSVTPTFNESDIDRNPLDKEESIFVYYNGNNHYSKVELPAELDAGQFYDLLKQTEPERAERNKASAKLV